jgi:SAM-dependent methyltransferase
MQSQGTSLGLACPTCQGQTWRSLYDRQGWNFVVCATCGLVRLDPIPTDEQLSDYYSRRFESGNYEPAKASERQPTLRGVFEEIADRGPGSLFDVGCFDGGLLDIAAEANWETWGLDYQGPAVEIARVNHPGHVFVGPLETFEPPRRDFEVVTGIGVIEHLRQPECLVRFAADALRPGGILVIQTPDKGSMPAMLLGRYWPPIAPPEHIWYFNRSNLTRLLTEAGFESVRVRSHWKRLRIGYAYEQLGIFGPELQRLARPVQKMPGVLNWSLPMYGGEMLLTAVRSHR